MHPHRPHRTRRAIAALALLAGAAHAQSVADLPRAEVERRNAAAGFVVPQAMTLAVLRAECRPYPATSGKPAEEIAMAWWWRNRDELDVSSAWLQRWMGHLQATDAQAHRAASAELMATASRATLDTLRTLFDRQLPGTETCARALRRYEMPELDLERLGKAPGLERFGEFAETLRQVRAEPGYQRPAERFRTFEAQVSTGDAPAFLASLDAAQRVRDAGGGPELLRIYESMALRGDGRAAQTLGLMHLRGEQVPADARAAYGWFHRAYVLGEGSGLNAMGVAWRDGAGVQAQPRTAYAAFLLASLLTREEAERSRARTNAERLASGLSDDDKAAVACQRVAEVDDALAAPVQGPAVRRPVLPEPQRRLGELVPALQPLVARCG